MIGTRAQAKRGPGSPQGTPLRLPVPQQQQPRRGCRALPQLSRPSPRLQGSTSSRWSFRAIQKAALRLSCRKLTESGSQRHPRSQPGEASCHKRRALTAEHGRDFLSEQPNKASLDKPKPPRCSCSAGHREGSRLQHPRRGRAASATSCASFLGSRSRASTCPL